MRDREIKRLRAALRPIPEPDMDARTALKLGGHLRPDGSVCSYIATTICNKCGTVPPHADAYFQLARYREALGQAGEWISALTREENDDG